MVTEELLQLVKFNPGELRTAIVKCEQEAEVLLKKRTEILELSALYRQILKTHGHSYTETEPQTPPEKPEPPVKEDSAPRVHDRRFRGMKIADAAVKAMTEAGGSMHGRKIVETLVNGGLRFGGEHAMDVLRGAMARDERIERVPNEKNTWRVKQATNP